MRTRWLICVAALLLGGARPAWADSDDDAPLTPRPLFDWPCPKELAPGELPRPWFDDHDPVDAPFPAPPAPRHLGCWTILGGVSFLEPQFQRNPAYLVTRAGESRARDFPYRLEAAPTFSLAYMSERGLGLRFRYFHFNESSQVEDAVPADGFLTPSTPLFPGGFFDFPGGTIRADSSLFVDAYDFEATYTCVHQRWLVLIGAGVRYAHLSQDYVADVGSAFDTGFLVNSHGFNGAGPSLALEAKRRLCDSDWALYGHVRGAALFGKTTESYDAVINGGADSQTFGRRYGSVVPYLEGELGLEWGCTVGCCRFFTQTGFNAQIWWNAGNASNYDPLEGRFFDGSPFGFVGVALRAGLTF